MEQCTPTFTKRRRKKKSSGDLLGSGKRQHSMVEYLSPSPSIRSAGSSCSSTPKLTKMSDSKKDESVSPKPKRKRPKKKNHSKSLSSNRQISLNYLSSDEESICEKNETKDSIDETKDPTVVSEEGSSRFKNIRRNLFLGDKSQTCVVISSSDDSEFELTTSKKSHDFSSQFQQSYSTMKRDDERLHPSTKSLEIGGSFTTSTPCNERVLAERELLDPECVSLKLEVSETIMLIKDSSMKRNSNLIIEDYTSLFVFNAKQTNHKLFTSKCLQFDETSTFPSENFTCEKELHRNDSTSENDKSTIDLPSHGLVTASTFPNGGSSSTIHGDFTPSFAEIERPSVLRDLPMEHGKVANGGSLIKLCSDETQVVQPAAVEESDNIQLLQDKTLDSSINQERNFLVSSIDGDEGHSFSNSKIRAELLYSSDTDENYSPKSTISNALPLEKANNGRISDSEDSNSEGHHSDRKSRMYDDSFEILPPTPTGPEENLESFHAGENLSSDISNDNLEFDIFKQRTNIIEQCSRDTDIKLDSNERSDDNLDDETNPKSCNSYNSLSHSGSDEKSSSGRDSKVVSSDSSSESSDQRYKHSTNVIDPEISRDTDIKSDSNERSGDNLDDETNPKSCNSDSSLSHSGSDGNSSSGRDSKVVSSDSSSESSDQRSKHSTNIIEQCSRDTDINSDSNVRSGDNLDGETNPKSCNSDSSLSHSGSDEKSSSGRASKVVSSDSVVGINYEQPLKYNETPTHDENSSHTTSSDNGSLLKEVLPDRVHPPIAKIDLKGVELSSKVICGVPSAPLEIVPHDDENLTLPSCSKTRTDHSYASGKPHSQIILLDEVISECKKFASLAFEHEPLLSFHSLYYNLTYDEKMTFHAILLVNLADEERWQRFHGHYRAVMDCLAKMNMVEYIGEHEDSLKLIDQLNNMEIISIFTSFGITMTIDQGDMREALILACKSDTEFGSAEKIKQTIKTVSRYKFMRIESEAIFCVKMCLELVSLCLHLREKVYKSVEIARHVDKMLKQYPDGMKLPLKIHVSTNLIDSDQEYLQFLDYCKLKAAFESGRMEDSSWAHIGSSIAICDFSFQQNVFLKEPTLLRLIYTNLVYILDHELKRKLDSTNRENFDELDFFCLGILLKQEFAGFGLKGVWSKRKVKYLPKLVDILDVDELRNILQQSICAVDYFTRSEFVSGLLENKKFRFSAQNKSDVTKDLRIQNHKKVVLENTFHRGPFNVNFKILSLGKKFALKKTCLLEKYGGDFENGLLDSGVILLNAVFLVFWPIIYASLDNEFVSQYQKCPLDWGSKLFYSKRLNQIRTRIASLERLGVEGVIDGISQLIVKFRGCHCILDWAAVSSTSKEMYGILKVLGLTRFCRIADYLLQHLDERQVGLPDLVVWNESTPQIKFVALNKKPNDPLHPHRVIWVEKLSQFGVDAEECQIIPKSNKLPTLQRC